ncbi:P-loop containing nucleoside triphosphate hydrolase protein [Lipomyces starkeyi]
MTEDLYNDFSVDQDRIYFYHGQLKTEQKALVLQKWINGDFALLFCTSGFGVGIDYGSVTLAIHYEGFWNLLDFAQESGRVGRNNRLARSLVLLRDNWSPIELTCGPGG